MLEKGKYVPREIEKMGRYTPFWCVANIFTKIFLKIALCIIGLAIGYDVYFLFVSIEIPESVSLTIYVMYAIGAAFSLIGLALFIVPIFVFRSILVDYKAMLSGITQDLYEKKLFHYLSLRIDEPRRRIMAQEISLLQDIIAYSQELNPWPFTIPQIVKLTFFSAVSILLPYVFDLFI